MATLSSDLQTSIDNLQAEHTKLVQAVRDYTGGSVAAATNDLLAAAADTDDSIVAVEKNLLGMINRSNEDKLPSLILDFVNDVALAGDRNVSRSATIDGLMHQLGHFQSGTAYEWGSDGRLVGYSNRAPAYAYDPYTGEKLGLALREGGTNMLDAWDDLTDTGEYVFTSNAKVEMTSEPNPIDGSGSALLMKQDDSSASSSYMSQAKFLSAERTYCISVMIKPYNPHSESSFRLVGHSNQFGESLYVYYLPDSDTVTCSGLPSDQFGVQKLKNGWRRIWFVAETAASIDGSSFALLLWPNGTTGTSGWYVTGAQIVATTDWGLIAPSNETRYPADLRLALDTGWYNPAGFSVVVDYYLQTATNSRFAVSLYGAYDNYVGADYRDNNLGYVIPGGSFSEAVVSDAVSRRKAGMSYQTGNGFVLGRLGETAFQTAPGYRDTDYNYLVVGNRVNSFYASGIYRELKVYSRFLNEEEMATETTL